MMVLRLDKPQLKQRFIYKINLIYKIGDTMAETIEIGTVSARGQVAIPAEIREKMHLKEGEKVLFVLEGDAVLMKKVSSLSWEEITRPLREAKKKIKESEVPALVHQLRKKR